MGQTASHAACNGAAAAGSAAAGLRVSYDKLLATGLDNASFMFYHGYLAKGGLVAKEGLAKRRDPQPLFLAILCHVIPECLDGNRDVAFTQMQDLLKDVIIPPDQFWCLKEALLLTLAGSLGAGLPVRVREAWADAADDFLAQLQKKGRLEPQPPPIVTELDLGRLSDPLNIGEPAFPYDEQRSETADGEEPETARDSRPDRAESTEQDIKNMVVEGFTEIVEYLLFQDKVSLFANEMNGFLCVEPEQDLQPLLDLSSRPMNFERFVFMFCSTEPGQQQLDSKTGPRISGDKHVMYGSTVRIKHVYTGKWLCVQKHLSANYSRNSYKVQLLPEDESDTACLKFKVLPRYKIRKHGEKVRIGDRALLVPEGTSKEQLRYIHASHHKWAGKTHLLEVNCAANPTSWTILLYDKVQPAQADNCEALIRAGEVITLIHKEIDGFLTSDAIDIVERFSADPTEASEPVSPRTANGAKPPSDRDPTPVRRAGPAFPDMETSPRILQTAEVPMHTLCSQMFQVLSNGPAVDAFDDSPLYFMQPQLKTTSMNPADLEISSNSLWIVEKATAVCGGPLAPLTPYRLKHFATSKYLTLAPAPGGSYKLEMTTEMAPDTFFMFHTLDQATRIVDSSTSFLRIQHQRTACWLQCPGAVGGVEGLMPGGRVARALHVHGSKVLPMRVSAQLPDGDVFAMVTPKGAPDVLLKKVLHHRRVLQDFNTAFYTQQYVYHCTQMQLLVRNAKTSLTELILFCTESPDTDPLTRTGIPLRRNQKVIIDQGVAKVVLEMLKCPFFPPRPGKVPMVPIKDITQPEHQALHGVCVLCYRLLKQMVFGSPSFALELCAAIPFMMKQLGYRFHVADTMSQMFTDNSMLIEHVSPTMIWQWIEHAQQQKNQLRYAKFLAKICVCNGVNIPRIQELVAHRVMVEAPELLVKMRYVPASEKTEEHVEILLGADAAAGEKNKAKAPELVPMERAPTMTVGDAAAARSMRTMRSVTTLMNLSGWKKKTSPTSKKNSVADLKKGAWVNLTTFCKEIGPALTGNLDATLMLFCEVCLHNDVVRQKVRALVPLELLLAILGENSRHPDIADKYLHRFSRLCTRLHLDQRGAMQAERNKMIVWSEVDLQPHTAVETWFANHLRDNNPAIQSLKAASLQFLAGVPIQYADQVERNTLIHAHLEMWHVFIQQSQCTFQEVRTLLEYLLPQLDYRTDQKSKKVNSGLWERWSNDPPNQVLLGCKGEVCNILHAVLDCLVNSAVHGALAMLRHQMEVGPVAPDPAPTRRRSSILGTHRGSVLPRRPSTPQTITEGVLQYMRTYMDHHELGAKLFNVPELLGILLDLAQAPDDPLTARIFLLIFRLFRFRSEVNRALHEVLILFNEECPAICDKLCRVVIAIKWFFDHIQQVPTEEQVFELMGHLDVLSASLRDCEAAGQTELYTAHQDILSNLSVFQYLVQVVRVSRQLSNYKTELLTKCYGLMRRLCVNHLRNKQVLLGYLDELVPHITFDVECDPCVREIFQDCPELAAQLQVMSASDGLVDAFTLLIAQEYTLKPQATVKNLAFLEQIVVINGMPVPRMQTLVMTSLLKHNSDFIMLLPEPCSTMSDELLQCIAAGVHLLGECALGKNNATETMVQNLFPLKGVLAVVSEMDHPIPVKYRLTYVFLLTEVWFVTAENELENATFENEYKWMTNEDWWEVVEAFVRVLAYFKDMSEDDPEFADYRPYVFQGVLPCFTSYLAHFWDTELANELPPQVTNITSSYGAIVCDYILQDVHAGALTRAELDALCRLLEQMERHKVECDGKLRLGVEYLQDRTALSARVAEKPPNPVHRGMEEMEMLLRPLAEAFDRTPVDNLEHFTEALAKQLEGSGEGDELMRAMLQRLEHNGHLKEETRIGLLIFLTDYVRRHDNAERNALYDCQVRMGGIGCLSVVTHLFETASDCSSYAVELGKAVLHGGNTVLQDRLLLYFQTHDEDFFVRISETFEAATDMLQEREREKSFLKEAAANSAGSPRSLQRHGFARKDRMLTEVESILRLLQLLCEGHHSKMQNYVRHQHDNLYSFNMVTEVACFLRAVVAVEPDDVLVDLATQAMNTLTEFCQGPCAENQRTLVSANICGDASVILSRMYPRCAELAVHVLRSAAVLTLLSLLEGCNDKMLPTLMVDTISIQSTCAILEEMWLKIQGHVENGIDLEDEDEEMMDRSFNIYILMYILLMWTKNADLDAQLKAVKGEPYFRSMLGVIEIARDDTIEKVYFRKPNACNMLTYEAKEELLSKINRDSPASKVSDFYERSTDAILELEFYQEAKKYLDTHLPNLEAHNLKLLRRLRKQVVEYLPQSGVQKLEDITLVISVALNLFVLLTASNEQVRAYSLIEYTLVAIQAVVSSLLTVLALLYDLPVLIQREMIKTVGLDDWQSRKDGGDSILWQGLHLRRLLALPIGIQFHYSWYLLLVVTSLMGFFISPLFCSFHMLGMCRRSAVLQSVIQSITANGKSLILTALLGMAVIYLFSVIAYLEFPQDFVDSEGNPVCTNLTQCFLFTLMHGLRQGGGIGDMLQPAKLDDPQYHTRMLFDFVFFVVVVVILLNIIFGIIIDTFAELRDQRQKIEEDTRRRCFICGIDSDTFDRHVKGGFDFHSKRSHNMWHYLYFLHHLKLKPVDEFTGQESYVAAKIAAKDMSFFPLGKAMDLIAAGVPEFATETQKTLPAMDGAMLQRLEQMENDISRLEQGMTTLLDAGNSRSSPNAMLHAGRSMMSFNRVNTGFRPRVGSPL